MLPPRELALKIADNLGGGATEGEKPAAGFSICGLISESTESGLLVDGVGLKLLTLLPVAALLSHERDPNAGMAKGDPSIR